MNPFKKAERRNQPLKMALDGPSGTGKTWTALAIMRGIVGPSGTIAAIDTERGAMNLYAGEHDFDHIRLDNHDPRAFIKLIQAAESAGYDGLIIDSFSHEWVGTGGVLELVDQKAAQKGGNSFSVWKDATPLHNAAVAAVVGSKMHVVATMRTKTDYKVEPNERGKMEPVKIGTAPVQRDGTEYEFDIIGRMDERHNLRFTKSRYRGFDNQTIHKPGREIGERLRAWLTGDDSTGAAKEEEVPFDRPTGSPAGTAPAAPVTPAAPARLPDAVMPDLCPAELRDEIVDLFEKLEIDAEDQLGILAARGVSRVADLTLNQANVIADRLRGHWRAKEVAREKEAREKDADEVFGGGDEEASEASEPTAEPGLPVEGEAVKVESPSMLPDSEKPTSRAKKPRNGKASTATTEATEPAEAPAA